MKKKQPTVKELIQISDRLIKMAENLYKWNKDNRNQCGHSNTPDSLGDEGWNKLFRNEGMADGYLDAANEILKLVKKYQ